MTEGRQPYSAGEAPASNPAPRPGVGRAAIATVTLLLLVTVFVNAGFWQLNRAAEKRAILDRYAAAGESDVITALVPDTAAHSLRFRLFRLTGHYRADRQFLLDNMTDGGRNGYQVLTPFVTASGTVLVNRGWIPADEDRSVLPDIRVGTGERTIRARLNELPAPGLRLTGSADDQSGWPRRLLFPSAEELSAALDVELPAYQLQLEADEPDGYLRVWRAAPLGPEKHLGYALQWFSFTGLAVLFYLLLMVQWLRARRTGR